ncbi:MAG: CapA family protein, partial [Lachnospiraceae bacterium]|nr:CapA family protein [Lachnospiraceae bacterium]
RNLDVAAAPAFLETPRGSFGVIGVVSTMMNPAAMAGRQSRRVPGRPGVNGLRVSDSVVVTPEEFDVLDRIIRKSKMNGQWDISRAEGFRPPLPEGTLNFRETSVEKGEETRYVTHPNEKDMQRIERNIISARSQCDCVLVTMHSHEVGLDDKELPADFYIEFAHRCIDAGASAVIGHGPHILRRVEMYKGRPIFYCLGNFVFQEEAQESYPEDMYEKYGVTSDTTIEELALLRTDHHRRGLLMNPKVLEAVIPYVELENDEVKKIELYPVSLGAELEYWQMGLPRPGFGRGILERLNALSVPYGTEIRIRKDGIGEIVL